MDTWKTTAPRFIYDGYPDSDLLPIDPPKAGEEIHDFAARAESAADTLFLFICREADDIWTPGEIGEDISLDVFYGRMQRAIEDIESVLAHMTGGGE